MTERTRNQVMRASRPWEGHRKTDLLSVGEVRDNPETKQVMSMKLHAGTAFRHGFRKLCRFVVTSAACDKAHKYRPRVIGMRAHYATSSVLVQVAFIAKQPIDPSNTFSSKGLNTRAIGWSNNFSTFVKYPPSFHIANCISFHFHRLQSSTSSPPSY